MLKAFGGVLFVVGIIWTGYALGMEVTVGYVDKIYNNGLMATRQLYAFVGSVTALAGIIIVMTGMVCERIDEVEEKKLTVLKDINNGLGYLSHRNENAVDVNERTSLKSEDLTNNDWIISSFFSVENGEPVLIYSAISQLVDKIKKENPGVHPKILSEKYDDKAKELIESLPDEIKNDFKRAYYAYF
ncbi:hypothetical protein [Pectobacterium fontis]|nr:hypothetical protein [Pectobacterium fontis]